MQLDTPFGELNRKRRRMRPFLFPALNCLIRNEPGIAATALIASAGVGPTSDIALVLIRHSDCQTIDVHAAGRGEVKNIFVTVVNKTFRADRLEVSERLNLARPILDRDRFDPVNRVLQNKVFSKSENYFVGQHRIRRRSADIEKKRTIALEKAAELRTPFRAPF